jgi:hypothetical protein
MRALALSELDFIEVAGNFLVNEHFQDVAFSPMQNVSGSFPDREDFPRRGRTMRGARGVAS